MLPILNLLLLAELLFVTRGTFNFGINKVHNKNKISLANINPNYDAQIPSSCNRFDNLYNKVIKVSNANNSNFKGSEFVPVSS